MQSWWFWWVFSEVSLSARKEMAEIAHRVHDSEGRGKQQPVKDSVLTDRQLRCLASELCQEWEPLATYLKFGSAEIFRIKKDNPNHTEDQIFKMLVEWKQRNPQSLGQIETLSKQLDQVGRKDLVHKLQQEILHNGEDSNGKRKQQPVKGSELTDRFVRWLANELGSEWVRLATLLGFGLARISKFKEDSLHDTDGQIFNMLVEWKQRNPPSLGQIETLSIQLYEVGRKDLAHKLQLEYSVDDKEKSPREPTEILKEKTDSRRSPPPPDEKSDEASGIPPPPTDEHLQPPSSTSSTSAEPLQTTAAAKPAQLSPPASTAASATLATPAAPATQAASATPATLAIPATPAAPVADLMSGRSTRQSEPVPSDAEKKGASSPEPTLLRTLLETFSEFHENPAESTETELLQCKFKLPYIAIAYFNESGGSLTLEKYNVHLHIPRGALARHPPQLVYIFVDPSAPPVDGVNAPCFTLSPMIQCGPPGLRFLDSVVLSFPHCANNEWELSTHMCLDDERTPKIWQPLDAKKDGVMFSKDNKVILLLKHFTLFVADGFPREASAKLVRTGAFGSLTCDPSDARYAVRIHVWNNDPVTEKKVIDMENDLDSKPLGAYRDLQVSYNQGDVNVNIDNITTGWELKDKTSQEQKILQTAVWNFSTNSVTFEFTRKNNDKSRPGCDSFVYQLKADSADSSLEGHKVRLSVRPKQEKSSALRVITDPKRQEEESCRICHKNASSESGICAACREEQNRAFTKNTGERTGGGFGGLSVETMKTLSCLLEDASHGRSNWIRLAEELFGQGTKFIDTLRRGVANPAKQILKLYFSFKREDGVSDQDAVGYLLDVFKRVDMKEAIHIVQAEPKTQAGSTLVHCKLTPLHVHHYTELTDESTTRLQDTLLELAVETYFLQLAARIGSEWEKLALLLDVTSDEVYRIKRNKVENVEKQIVTMLRLWKNRCEVDGTNWECVLAEKLRMVGRADLAKLINTDGLFPKVKKPAHGEHTQQVS